MLRGFVFVALWSLPWGVLAEEAVAPPLRLASLAAAAPAPRFPPAPNPFFAPANGPIGDTFPICKDGVWHLFHMHMPRIGHHTSRDLVHWEERPTVVAPGGRGEPDAVGLCTGVVVEHEGKYYCFYTGHWNVCLAISDDLEHWTKHPGNPVLVGDDRRYAKGMFHDPYVFWHDGEKQWWMLLGCQEPGKPVQRAGCVGLAKSRDLIRWELADPLWAPEMSPRTDCPQVIQVGARWYLLYLDRQTCYRIAEGPTGPWRRPPVGTIGTMMAAAGSRPAFDGKRWLAFPWVARLRNEDDRGDLEFGGPMAVPRQWEFGDDGAIAERPADEILAAMRSGAAGNPRPLEYVKTFAGQWEVTDHRNARCITPSGTLLVMNPPRDFYFEAEVTIPSVDGEARLLLNTAADITRGYQLVLKPDRRLVTLRPVSKYEIGRDLESQGVDLPIGRPFALRVFRAGSIVEVFLDDRVSLTCRLHQYSGMHIGFEFRDGGGAFQAVYIADLAPPAE